MNDSIDTFITADAEELRRAHEREAQSQAILRIAGGVAHLGGWVLSMPDQRVTWSDETAAILGEPAGFSPPLSDAIAYYAPEYRDGIQRVVEACAQEGVSFDVEAQAVTRQGRRIWVRVFGEAVRGPSGEVTQVQGALQDISDKKASEEQIRTLASRLQDTLETHTDAFLTLDGAWRVTYLNPAAERFLARKRAELLGRNLWTEFKRLVDGPSYREYHRALEQRISVTFEEYVPELKQWVEAEAHPSSDGLAVYFRDVTDRRRIREELRQSEERFRHLAKATNDAIWDWNLVTGELWRNDEFATLFGYAPNQFEPTSEAWTSHLHPEDRDSVLASVRATVDGSAVGWSGEYRFRCKDGSYAYVMDRASIIRDGSGRPVRMLGGITDLTERRRVEERLRQQAALLDQATDAIVVRDLQHRILYWNRSAEKLYGWSAAEAVGHRANELLFADPAGFHAAVEATIAHGEWSGELEQVARDRHSVTVEGHWSLVRDDHGTPTSIFAINTDITQRRKLEAQFLRAQRMESIGDLAGGIAHDLNNTLAPILLTVSLLRKEEQDPERREDLATIDSCAHRAADMVRQLLSFARGTDGRRTLNDLGRVAAEIQKMVRDTFPKDITFKLNVAPGLWEVSSDATQMHQLLTNLCVNARDAMPHGGVLSVVIEHVQLDDVEAGMILEAHPGPYVVVGVEDTGTGIPAGILDRIFEPFFTTKEPGKGTGLGLSTAHAIVRSHGGFIHVYSELGKGTRFKVYLPANPSAGPSTEPPAEQAVLPRGNGEWVLVVDDEELIRGVTQRTLERFGYRVLLASNGAEAISQYVQHRQEVAVVLTDMAMPVMDGPATIVALRSLNPKIRIIGSSGFNADGHVSKAAGGGVRHFVPKPYTAETLLMELKAVLSEPG